MAEDKFPGWHGTTILAVRRGGRVVVAGDGQVSVGQTVMKGTARKVRRLTPGGRDVVVGFDAEEFDAEGRYVETRFDTPSRKLSIISAYFPSGSSGELRQEAKFRFLAKMHTHLMKLKGEREFVLCGDINIAHQKEDLKNWRGNQKNSGFLPEERDWMSQLLHKTEITGGLVDVYRQLQPDTTDACYTWWSNRGQAYANNVGWRLDYHLATPAIAALARSEAIYKDVKFSDHAPITIGYDMTL